MDTENKPLEKYYRKIATNQFSTEVDDNLFIRNDYHDTIMKIIANSLLNLKKEYKYSDFTFIILKEYLERKTKKKLIVVSQHEQ